MLVSSYHYRAPLSGCTRRVHTTTQYNNKKLVRVKWNTLLSELLNDRRIYLNQDVHTGSGTRLFPMEIELLYGGFHRFHFTFTEDWICLYICTDLVVDTRER